MARSRPKAVSSITGIKVDARIDQTKGVFGFVRSLADKRIYIR